MKTKSTTISINALSVLVILMCLLLSVIAPVNSWFRDSHENGVQIIVDVGTLNLKVYQNALPTESEMQTNPTKNEIFSNETNTKYETDKNEDQTDNTKTNPQYIALGGEIKPDTAVPLKLILANKDEGSASMYVRFKLEVYARGFSGDTLLEGVTLSGYDVPLANATQDESAGGFVFNSADGYYYYQSYTTETNFSNSNNARFAKDEDEIMLTHFTVPYSAFVCMENDNPNYGEFIIKNSDTVYIKLVVQGDISQTFANV